MKKNFGWIVTWALLTWVFTWGALVAHAGNSTINTTVPAANSALQSAPIRANFLAAATDINGLIGMNNSATAPASPVLGQLWLNTTATPYVLNVWDGAAWDAVGTLNSSAHRWLVPIPQGGTGLTSPGAVGNVLTSTGTAWASTAPTNIGTVTSVGLILPTALFNTTGSPITTSGTFAASLNSQSTGTFFAGPATGGSAVPTFRGIAVSDVPTLNQNTTGTAANVTGVVGVANGGTALTSPGASGNVLTSNGTGWVSSTPTAGSVSSVGLSLPLSLFSVSGSPVTTSGTLTGTLNTEPANYVWAGPTTGSAAQPAFRGLVLGDLPSIACGNLSNATTACSTAIGTSGAVLPLINGNNQWGGFQIFGNNVLELLGSSTGVTSFASANASATNYTITFPAATGTVATTANINTALPSTSALYKGTGGAGVAQAATSGTDYAPATSGSAILKGNGAGGFSSAVSATDYAPATTGSSVLKASSGGFANALNSDLPAMSATVGGAVPTPPNNTTTFLRGDATFAAPAISWSSLTAPTANNSVTATINTTQTVLDHFDTSATANQAILALGEDVASTKAAGAANAANLLKISTLSGSTAWPFAVYPQGARTFYLTNVGALNFAGLSDAVTGAGGSGVNFAGGPSASANAAGNITWTGGANSSSGQGGSVGLAGGAASSGPAGNVVLTSGLSTSGVNGTIKMVGNVVLGYTANSSASYTVTATDYCVTNSFAGTTTLTLPAAASYTGMILHVRVVTANTVVSASSNIVPLAGGSTGTAILAATAGKWADLQSDGTNWQITASN
jgi:hypothetical protein